MAAVVALSEKVLSAKSIICDIEGTTTSISFVKDTLFPYALKNVEEYLKNNWNEDATKTVVAALREQADEDKKAEVEGVTEIPVGDSEDIIPEIVKNVEWQMSQDRKTGSLKTLQGLVWAKGYKDGTIKGHVYDDVQKAFEQWTENGRKIYIYSSGSVDAQKLLFEHSEQGNLLKYLTGHYDTKVGAKREKASYESILKNIESSAEETLFLTDVFAEAKAAKDAGLNVVLLDRPGNAKLSEEERKEFTVISTFSDLSFEAVKKENGDTVSNGAKRKIEDTIEEDANQEEDPAQEPPTKVTKVEEEKAKEPAENGATDDKCTAEPSPSTEPVESKSTEKMEIDGGEQPVNNTDTKEENVEEKMEEDSTVEKTEGTEKMDLDKKVEPVEVTAKLNTETGEKTEAVEKEPEIEKEAKVVEKVEPLAKEDITASVKVAEEDDKNEKEKEVKPAVETPKENEVVKQEEATNSVADKVETTTVDSVTSDPVVEEKKGEENVKETLETEKETLEAEKETKTEEVTTVDTSKPDLPVEEKVDDKAKKEDEKVDEVKTDKTDSEKTDSDSVSTDKEVPTSTNEVDTEAKAELNGTEAEAKATANGSSKGEEEKNGSDSDKENDTSVNNCEADEADAEKTNGTVATTESAAEDVTSSEIKAKKVIEPVTAAVTPAPPIEAES